MSSADRRRMRNVLTRGVHVEAGRVDAGTNVAEADIVTDSTRGAHGIGVSLSNPIEALVALQTADPFGGARTIDHPLDCAKLVRGALGGLFAGRSLGVKARRRRFVGVQHRLGNRSRAD